MNQPLNAAIQTGLGNVFSLARRWRFCSREPRSPGSSSRNTVLRTGFGLFSDILPGSVVDLVGVESALLEDFPGRACSARWAARRSRREFPTARSMRPSRRISTFNSGFRARPTFLRLALGESGNLPSARRHHRRAGWQTSRALLHAVELRAGASDRNDG